MIPNEIQRLIYQCIMGGKVVVISPDDKLASERFKELREVVVIAADELRATLDKVEREIIYGKITDQEVIGLFSAQEAISAMGVGFQEASEKMFEAFIGTFKDSPLIKPLRRIWRENCNNYRKLHALPLKRRPRCRWRQRESRRTMEGLSPGVVVVIDECAFNQEGSC